MLWDPPFHFASTFLTFGNEEATVFDFHDLQEATNASPDTDRISRIGNAAALCGSSFSDVIREVEGKNLMEKR